MVDPDRLSAQQRLSAQLRLTAPRISLQRYSIDTDELMKRIHASKPKSVFLDANSKTTYQGATSFGKKSKIDITEQGLQTIKRAAFATETSDEVNSAKSIKCSKYLQISSICRILSIKVHCLFIDFYVRLEFFHILALNLAELNLY